MTSDVSDDDDSSSDVANLDSKVNALVEQVSQLVSAIVPRPSGVKPTAKPKPGPKPPVKRSSLPTPSPSFKGCWHCLSEDHVRRKCPDFQKILKANGGKLPKGYEGAFEKWHKSQKRVAAAILDADDDDDDAESDWSDTDIALTAAIYGHSAEDDAEFFMCGQCTEDDDDDDEFPLLPRCTAPCCEIANPFAALEEIDDHDESDDEDKIINSLRQISRNVTVGPKISQRSKKGPAPISKKKLRKIVAAIDNGDLSLPDAVSQCGNDTEVDYVWALVDSGSYVNIANQQMHFPRAKLRPSSLQSKGVKSVAANGTEITMSEEMVVKAFTSEGEKARIVFQNGDVQMPIISVARLSEHHDTLFNDHGGKLVHRDSGKETPFVKRSGVYFIRLAIPADKRGSEDNRLFAWPGA